MIAETSQRPRLTPIANNLWGVEHDLFLPGGVHFRGRMTVVRLDNGSLLLHSPIPIDRELAAELEALGNVEHLVAPNAMHHVHLSGALERYPTATLYGPAALQAKRKDLTFTPLSPTATESWRRQLSPLQHEGAPKLDEVVFFHASTRSLLVADYFFNIQGCRGWLTPWVLRLNGTYKRFAQSRVWRWAIQDKPKASQSAERMLEWPFDRIVPAHGEVVADGAHARAEHALKWLTGAAPKALPASV